MKTKTIKRLDYYETKDLLAERDRLKAINAELVAALGTLIASLEWECNRSGTTYNGYESARAALTAAKGE